MPANEVAERAERIRTALEADGGFALTEPTEHGEDPITAVHDAGLVRFLEAAWSELRAPGHPARVPVGRHVPQPRDVRGHERRRGRAARRASRATSVAGPGSGASTPPRRSSPARTSPRAAAVDVALTTVDLVLGGETAAYGLCRPPGHHAARAMYGGYCFFNNAAIAAQAITASHR